MQTLHPGGPGVWDEAYITLPEGKNLPPSIPSQLESETEFRVNLGRGHAKTISGTKQDKAEVLFGTRISHS